LPNVILVDSSFLECTIKEIENWFFTNNYYSNHFKKEFSSLSEYVCYYARYYIEILRRDRFVLQKEDVKWLEENKDDYNTAFALLD